MTANLPTWQAELANAFTHANDLLRYLDIDPDSYSAQAAQNFAMRVPLSYAACMQKGQIDDPLLQQVLPIAAELDQHLGYSNDPVGDLKALTESCIIHKYQGRVLFISTGGCAINCRFCFRRNFPYQDVQLSKRNESQALAYLRAHQDIHEVILSGGDPLLLSDQRLQDLIHQLTQISHIKRIRIHSRIPITLPSRITPALIHTLQQAPLPIIMVTHCNHANELSATVQQACLALKQSNISLLNQSVLLKGVNNNLLSLQQLSERLLNCGILPYYLHLLDHAQGTAHFAVNDSDALHLHQQLQHSLPGYLVPKLVQEQAGQPAKTLRIK